MVFPARLSRQQYLRFLFSPLRGVKSLNALVQIVLLFLGQFCAFIGYLLSRLEDAAGPQQRSLQQQTGRFGRPLFTFLTSIGISSFFGFLFFMFAARWLSVVELGIFSACFSIISLLQYLSVSGVATSTIRFALEYQKKDAITGIQRAVTAGTVLFLTYTVFFCGMLATGTFLFTAVSAQAEQITTLLWPTLSVAVILLFNEFLTTQFSITLSQQKLAAVRLYISLLRFLLLAAFYAAGSLTFVNALISLAGPSLLGIVFMFPEFNKYLISPFSISRNIYTALARYSLWQTISVSIAIICYNSGSMILFGFGKVEEAGLYGLALSLSFVFSVVQSALTTYFLPIGSRITPEEFPDILRRTSRLAFPIVIISLLSVLLMNLYFADIFGREKETAYLPFVLLSFGYILGYTFPLLTIGLHVFFKPRYITIGLTVQLIIFTGLIILWRANSALIIASAFCLSRIGYMAATWVLLQKELQTRQIHIPLSTYLTFGFGDKS
jgi:O-antigen/teichoic acid export membrane protein